MLARVLAGARRDFRREQAENKSVLVRAPGGAVPTQEAGAGTFLAAETARAIEQSWSEEFEAHRNFEKLSAQFSDDAIDQTAADHGLADRGRRRPLRAMSEQMA